MNPDWVAPVTIIDPSLPTGFADTKFDLNAGLYWKGAGDYYAGISATHLQSSSWNSSGNDPAGPLQLLRIIQLVTTMRWEVRNLKMLSGHNGHLDANVLDEN